MFQIFFNIFSQIEIFYVDYLITIFLVIAIVSIGSRDIYSNKKGIPKLGKLLVVLGTVASIYMAGKEAVKYIKEIANTTGGNASENSNTSNGNSSGSSSGNQGSNSKVKQMISLFPFSLMDINLIPDTVSGLEQALYGIIILTLLTLWSFIDIIGHFITIYLIDHAKIIDKYPRLRPILNYFRKTNYIFLTIEIIFIISIYLMLVGVCIRVLFEI